MSYRVNRVDAHSTNLVSGPHAELNVAIAERTGLLKNDPRGTYEIRTHEGTLVELTVAPPPIITPDPVPDATIPDSDMQLDVSVFHVEEGVIAPAGTMTTDSTPEPVAVASLVIPAEPTGPAPPMLPGSDVIPS